MADNIEYRRSDRKKTGSLTDKVRAFDSARASKNGNGTSESRSARLEVADEHAAKRDERTRRRLEAGRTLRPPKTKSPLVALLVFGIVGILIASLVFCGWHQLIRSPGPDVEPGREVAVIIPEGARVRDIADILVERGIVANPLMFQIMARLKGGGAYFQPGRFMLVTGSGYEAAIAALSVTPEAAEVVRVTIIEGLRIDQVAHSVADQLGLSPTEFEERARTAAPDYVAKYPYLEGAFQDSLEGFLFPDTYEFTADATVDDVIERQLARFDEVWQSIQVPQDRLDSFSVGELVTIASLCEREARLDDERSLVASVIDNRLQSAMMLQFCSTVQFLLPPERLTDLRLSDADTRIDSPYNTYIHEGLPPGPICNPSRLSLEAAARPAITDYLYFALTSQSGEQTFSVTYEEHEEAMRISQEVFGQ
ncbi:MAG: endolytic transglycosylase MltG [Actinomycetia bacterium]|nr:endolytic transglycosylase MltG [Actinomycetes bacterium]